MPRKQKAWLKKYSTTIKMEKKVKSKVTIKTSFIMMIRLACLSELHIDYCQLFRKLFQELLMKKKLPPRRTIKENLFKIISSRT